MFFQFPVSSFQFPVVGRSGGFRHPEPQAKDLPAGSTLSAFGKGRDPSPAAQDDAGFTLVELSIVLVVIGLILGGVMVGRDMLESVRLKAVLKEQETIEAAVQTFISKYNALPGDMTNATKFWGKDMVACPGQSGVAATPGTCNGGGNGRISDGGIPYNEHELAWFHLLLSGLLQGNRSDVGGSAFNTEILRARARPGTYWIISPGNHNGLDFGYNPPMHFIRVGGFTPAEAYAIDQKVDDGLISTGSILTGGSGWCGTPPNYSTLASLPPSPPYNCTVMWLQQF
jgi:prepilin-type N-terminal cleavage/methylation domain-containing protein